ncbi:hypothetical protein IT570_03810 [Candidatus Sumerlaeota bacterium]|nr:hypothetical protein [Candidatus Sumerlaeota bacterium]
MPMMHSWTLPRSGTTPEASVRTQGGCLTVFGLPFLSAGLFMLYAMIEQTISGKIKPFSLLFAIPFTGVFILIGGWMIVHGGRILFGKYNPLAPKLKVIAPGSRPESWPYLPKLKRARRGPRGAVLLPLTTSVAAGLIVMIVICLFWNGIVGIATYAILFKEQHTPFAAKIFLGVFGFVGLLIIWMVIHRIAQLIMTGSSEVEMSSEPLFPGAQAKVYLYTQRDVAITEVTASIKCAEHVTYRSGKNSRTDHVTWLEKSIYEAKDLNSRAMRHFAEVPITIPEDALTSFRGSANSITWEITLKIKVPGKPDIDDSFSFRVAPGAAK